MFTSPSKKTPTSERDPLPGERVYYRHATTGDLGYLVTRDGNPKIKYDLNSQDRVVPFRQGEWIPEKRHAPLTVGGVARVAYEADKALCQALGIHGEHPDWLSLPEQKRIRFSTRGPSDGPEIRQRLWGRTMQLLSELTK